MEKITNLADAKARREKERYKHMVMEAYDGMEHLSKRQVLDRKAKTESDGRERL